MLLVGLLLEPAAVAGVEVSSGTTSLGRALRTLADASMAENLDAEAASRRENSDGRCRVPATSMPQPPTASSSTDALYEEPYRVLIKDLFNFNDEYWVKTVESWGMRDLNAELEAYGLLDLDAEGEEISFEDEAYDACT